MENNKPKWDGKSRISNDTYRERWEEIYGQKEQEELNESYKQSLRNKEERENEREAKQMKREQGESKANLKGNRETKDIQRK